MSLIAKNLELTDVMLRLGEIRPVFHSEADFQHAFAQVVHDMAPLIQIRLEVRQRGGEHLDLLCFEESDRSAIEFKYVTAAWEGGDGLTDEVFRLRSHAAMDLARLGFVRDIRRLELFCAATAQTNGLAVILSNCQSLWSTPKPQPTTNDQAFRIHEGRTLSGELLWGGGYRWNDCKLSGTYSLAWLPYRTQNGSHEDFRWLVAEVTHSR
jgi:hypothetical protein